MIHIGPTLSVPNHWSYNEMIGKYGKPVDKDEWYMTHQTVNA